ncbi:hypothetical protein [Streptomyces sp. NPDC058694]|uniref:hypothetical protein n=1 Tax=Streptomyces sp. NPDC058694 TaxID=3346603 RepID=UPI003667FF50
MKHPFVNDCIDDSFGRWAPSATTWWQVREELEELEGEPEDVDGVVGKETFGHTDDFLDGS